MKKTKVFTALCLTAVLIIGSAFSASADEAVSERGDNKSTKKNVEIQNEKEETAKTQKASQAKSKAEEAADSALEQNEADTSTKKASKSASGDTKETGKKKKNKNTEPKLEQQVVDYALSWVGVTPYVWAGNSLTTGTDCSGFVHLVYENFGIDVPRSSYDFRSCGTEVAYEDAQPGDIICYEGHVALYIGDGAIVHASDEATGTKITEDATYSQILTVRRVI